MNRTRKRRRRRYTRRRRRRRRGGFKFKRPKFKTPKFKMPKMNITKKLGKMKDMGKKAVSSVGKIGKKGLGAVGKIGTKGMSFGNYNKLNASGIIPQDSLVENKDVIIGKVIPIKANKCDQTKIIKYLDQSKIYRTKENSYIDKNYIEKNGDGYTFCKVRIRTYREPQIGDKFSSRHGQKGTIGIVLPEEDMPFTADGIRPDIIINPHAIPSRMTIGQLKETILGKILQILGFIWRRN